MSYPLPVPSHAEVAGGYSQATLDSLPGQIALIDARGHIVAVNASWRAFALENGGEVCSWAGVDYLAVTGPVARAGLGDVLAGRRDAFEHEYACGTRHFRMRATPYLGAGRVQVIVLHQDVTERREALASADFRSRLLDTVDAAVVALDPGGVVTAWNQGAELLYGWAPEEAIGRDVDELVPTGPRPPGRWEGELELARRDGTRFPAWVRRAVLEEAGEPEGSVSVSIDITERRQVERSLRSARDYMAAVTASIDDGLCTLDRSGRVVYLNPRGEELLGWSAGALAGRDLHDAVQYARADGTPYPSAASPLVQARRDGLALRVQDDVMIREDGRSIEVQQALTPFETEDGTAGFVLVFSDISARKAQARESEQRLLDLTWIERIRSALDEDRLVLHAQPIVRIDSGCTTQHELLIRMLTPEGEVVPPGAFLPVAETYGLIGEIDRWVVGQAMELAATGLSVELNLSAHSLGDRTLAAHVDAELRRTGADPALIVFELTETALLRDEEAAFDFVQAVVARGCKLALDDFGTGYGGFAYLKRLPVAFLKIDIEFVRDLVTEPASRQVVDAVVSLARGFGIETVAEGVEDEETLVLLARHGVDYAQGYHLGRPLPLTQEVPAP